MQKLKSLRMAQLCPWLIVLGILKSMPAIADPPSDAHAYYFPFGAERFIGLHEDEMKIKGCKFTINADAFAHLLSHAAANHAYIKFDIRAEVVLESGEEFYVDSEGNVRSGDRFFTIDRKDFVKLLKSDGPCEIYHSR